jgi:guanylate kinase
MIYVVSGPSGCGKSTLIGRVLASLEDVRFSISHTTRKRRESEVEGKDYYFVDRGVFQKMVRRGQFVESALVHGAYYGTSKKELAKGKRGDVILDIDIQGARQIQKRIPSAVSIFVLPPSFAELRKRIKSRGLDSVQAVRDRMNTARKEVRAYGSFDYVLINDDLDRAARELTSILQCRRALLPARKRTIQPILKTFRGKR